MQWLPKVEEFRQELGSILKSQDAADALERLVRLAQHDLNYLQTVQLDQVLDRLEAPRPDGYGQTRLAVLASSTADHLLPAIRVAQLRRSNLTQVYLCPYGQNRQELLNPDSGVHDFHPDFVVFSQTAQEAIAGVPVTASSDEVHDRISAHVKDLVSLWEKAQRSLNATIIQQTILNTADTLFGSFDRQIPGAPVNVIRTTNEAIAKAAADNGVLIVDMERAVEIHGLRFWFDITKWLQAKIEVAPPAAPLYGELVSRIISARDGSSRKCLVLDLDNTLWGGVIGDDGIDQIVLGEGSALGEAFLAFQRYVKRLSERGILLAVCSKNDLATAEAAFDRHPEMQLGRSDFAAFVANWDDKAANVEQIARRLNIGIDSLVFVDDNPAERARIRQSLPMVAVPELPEDPAQFVDCLSAAGYFEAISFTADDAIRGRQYAENESRRELQAASESLDDYLESLEMSVSCSPFLDVDLQRVAQLVNKTNQFNATTRRRSLDAIRDISKDPANMTLQFRLIDRFGDNGLVSAVILRPTGAPGVLDIDTWIMSCRVFGRQLEFEIMNLVVDAARSRGVRSLSASYIPTAKNKLIKDLYPSLGFQAEPSQLRDDGEGTRWRLDIDGYAQHETHISVSRQAHDQ